MEFKINADLVFADMVLDDGLRQKCRAIFFESMKNGKSINFIINEIYPLLEEKTDIYPKSLLSYIVEKYSKTDFSLFELLHIYIQTYANACFIREQQETSGACGKGLKIMVAHADCPICQKHDGVKYVWNNLKQMPSVPLHWGCSCTISVFFE